MAQINTRSFIRFLAVGGSATLLHYVLIFVFVLLGWFSHNTASGVGFALSACFNYWANARFTFSGKKNHLHSLPRFAITALLGCVINVGVLYGLQMLGVPKTGLPFAFSQLFATGVVLIWNYMLNALWTFKTP